MGLAQEFGTRFVSCGKANHRSHRESYLTSLLSLVPSDSVRRTTISAEATLEQYFKFLKS